jgi:hypothetical protein
MEIDYNDLDLDRLRSDLQDYFTSAYFIVSPLALADLSSVETATDSELISIARRCGFNLTKYLKTYRR